VTRLPTVTLVDYGAGNPASVLKAFRAIGANVRRAVVPDQLPGACAIVIPGVGHFSATSTLGPGWRRIIRAQIEDGVPLLGICLGLQWLFDDSDEAPGVGGIGLFNGSCFRLRGDVKVPHVGWNTLQSLSGSWLLDGIRPGSSMYFTHTFAAPVTAGTVATTEHGLEFASVVERGLVVGTQFHPEKSGRDGLRLLANFLSNARETR
jgi:imidazole glycerol-phosphate synthase subunit HisH